ncbi:Zinc-binding dehydrogenase [Ceratobasidium sp. AG-Ba]|nr:Zinc-binding dehydrogenase [Ceratobasidium sp. AG-Ba]
MLIPQRLYPGPFSFGPDGQGHILTSDGAGEVVAVGQGETEWSTGDRVLGSFYETWSSGEFKKEDGRTALGGGVSGCLAQYKVYPSNSLVRIPSHLTYEEASTLPCAGLTAWACLFETTLPRPIGSHSTILVQGSGGISVFGAQLAKAAGARVIATTSSAEKIEQYKSIVGVDDVINYRENPNWSDQVLALSKGGGVEHVLEVGGQTTFLQSLKSTQFGGHIHILGIVGGNTNDGINFGEFSFLTITRRLNLHGQAVGSKDMLKRMVKFVEEHNIKPVVGKVFDWEHAVEAFDYIAAGSHFGKVVVKIQ